MIAEIDTSPYITLRLPRHQQHDDAFFAELAAANRDMRLERDADGNLILMPPTHSETGRYNADLLGEIWSWNRKAKIGYVFDSSTGFTLASSAIRSPDVAWIRKDRWDRIPPEDRDKFAAICPDFVIEVRSGSDSIRALKAKMEEYRYQGCALGWLIDRLEKQVLIYRADGSVEIRTGDTVLLNGETVLPGLELRVEF